MQRTMRGRRALFPSPRIKTASHPPHLHSTVGLGVVSSTGGAAGTPSMSGAGTTLSVHRGRAGIVAGFQISEPNVVLVPAVAQFAIRRSGTRFIKAKHTGAPKGPGGAWGYPRRRRE
jgi:hypothetical protein